MAKNTENEPYQRVELQNIPNDIFIEILVRLPAKSLFKFMFVNKRWYSLITHPSFADLFLSHNNSSLGKRLFLIAHDSPSRDHGYGTGTRCLLVDDPNEGEDHWRVSHLPKPFLHWNDVTNTVNGLVCLYNDDHRTAISVYNITTRERVYLPHARLFKPGRRRCYLGIHPMTRKYVVLHLYSSNLNTKVSCQVLTVGTYTWRTVKTSHILNILNYNSMDQRGVYHDGFIYWTTSCDRGMCAFNIERDTLELIPYPQQLLVSKCTPSEISVCRIGGQVSIVEFSLNPYSLHFDNFVRIWVWKLIIDPKDYRTSWSGLPQGINLPFGRASDQNRRTITLGCSDFGLFSINYGNGMVELYDIETSRRSFLPNRTRTHYQNGFNPSLFIENITPIV